MRRPAMQRPIMDPTFLDDDGAQTPEPSWRIVAAWTGRALRWAGRQLLARPIKLRRQRVVYDDRTPFGKLLRGACYRLLFLPLFLMLISLSLVFAGTHPLPHARGNDDPSTQGVYYDPVSFASEDGTRLQGWLVPMVDAHRVVLHKEHLLHEKHAAIVLVHDFAQSQQQMLPLLAPLHEDGYVVLAVGLRGVGLDRCGQTFGIKESQDVISAVELLRRRPFVDPDRVAVLGIGTGANAAVLAAERDPRLAALVLVDPIKSVDEAIARHIGPDRWGVRWVQTLNRWTFQVAYRVDADDLRLARSVSTLTLRPVLRLDGKADGEGRLMPPAIEQTRDFLQAKLSPAAHKADPPLTGAGE